MLAVAVQVLQWVEQSLAAWLLTVADVAQLLLTLVVLLTLVALLQVLAVQLAVEDAFVASSARFVACSLTADAVPRLLADVQLQLLFADATS